MRQTNTRRMSRSLFALRRTIIVFIFRTIFKTRVLPRVGKFPRILRLVMDLSPVRSYGGRFARELRRLVRMMGGLVVRMMVRLVVIVGSRG